MSEEDCSDKISHYKKYNEFKTWRTNTCIRCDKKFKVKVYKIDDARFIRFCQACRASVNKGYFDVDFTESVGH